MNELYDDTYDIRSFCQNAKYAVVTDGDFVCTSTGLCIHRIEFKTRRSTRLFLTIRIRLDLPLASNIPSIPSSTLTHILNKLKRALIPKHNAKRIP